MPPTGTPSMRTPLAIRSRRLWSYTNMPAPSSSTAADASAAAISRRRRPTTGLLRHVSRDALIRPSGSAGWADPGILPSGTHRQARLARRAQAEHGRLARAGNAASPERRRRARTLARPKSRQEDDRGMQYLDRRDAGRQLAAELIPFAHERPVIVALPRGGVPVGIEVARALHAPIEIMAVRKIGAPGNPELAVGAVAEDGTGVLDPRSADLVGMTKQTLDETLARE